jgi:hypothetical protein
MRSILKMHTGLNPLSAPMGATQLALAFQWMGSDTMEIAADWYIAYETLLTVSMPDVERGCLGICSCGSPAVTRMDFGAFCSRVRAWQFRIQRRGQDCRERDMPQL